LSYGPKLLGGNGLQHIFLTNSHLLYIQLANIARQLEENFIILALIDKPDIVVALDIVIGCFEKLGIA